MEIVRGNSRYYLIDQGIFGDIRLDVFENSVLVSSQVITYDEQRSVTEWRRRPAYVK